MRLSGLLANAIEPAPALCAASTSVTESPSRVQLAGGAPRPSAAWSWLGRLHASHFQLGKAELGCGAEVGCVRRDVVEQGEGVGSFDQVGRDVQAVLREQIAELLGGIGGADRAEGGAHRAVEVE